MFGRTTKILFEIVATLALLLAIAGGVLAWRLNEGPISLAPLKGHVERAINADDASITIDFDDLVLAWGGWERALELRLRGLGVLARDGRLLAYVPEAAISVSGRALLRGAVAPTRIVVIGPKLNLIRTADGAIRIEDDPGPGGAGPGMNMLLAGLLDSQGPADWLAYLDVIQISEGELRIEDAASGATWRAPDAEITLRRHPRGIAAEASLAVDLGGGLARLRASGVYDVQIDRADLALDIATLTPAALARFDPALAPLAALDFSIGGRVIASIDGQGRPRAARFDLAGGPGRIVEPTLFAAPVVLRSFAARGVLVEGLDRLDLTELAIDLGGPTLRLSGSASGFADKLALTLNASARNLPTDRLGSLWPIAAAPNARKWVLENLSGGGVGEARAELALRQGDGAAWIVERVAGQFDFSGLNVSYLRPMPAVNGVRGSAQLSRERLDFTVNAGAVGNLRVGDSKIAIIGLSGTDHRAVIDLAASGPLGEALRLIDGAPLGFMAKIGQKPEDFTGQATISLGLRFPLIARLRLDDLDVQAEGEATRLTQKKAALGQDITDGRLKLKLDGKGMALDGDVVIGTVPARVGLTRSFQANQPVVGRLVARGALDQAQRSRFGFDFFEPYVEGRSDHVVTLVDFAGGRQEVTVDGDLTQARLVLSDAKWEKPPGTPGAMRAVVRLESMKAREVSAFSVTGGGLETDGKVTFAEDGVSVSHIDVDRFALGRTRLAGRVDRAREGWSVRARGPGFDAAPFLRDNDKSGEERTPFTFDVEVDRVYLAEDRFFQNVRGTARRTRAGWEAYDLRAITGVPAPTGNSVSIAYAWNAGKESFSLGAEDAGTFLRLLDISPNVVGGRLEASGETDAARPDRALAGRMAITEFRVINAPVMARVLGVALLTGIADALRGDGIRFARMDAEWAFVDPRLDVRNARAFGPNLGVTARGWIDRESESVELDGTLVPAYAVNSLLGNIPIIGPAIVGERGGGLFAANYKIAGPLADAQISVNALSALAPGFLRYLFPSGRPGEEAPPVNPNGNPANDMRE